MAGDDIVDAEGHPATPPWKRPTILVGSVMLAGIAAVFVPKGLWLLRENANVASLTDEVRRLGGSVSIPEGGVDIWGGRLDVNLDLSCTDIGDAEFARLTRMAAFKHVTLLSLVATRITDESLERLADNPNIIALDVSRTMVTNKGLESVASMAGLSVLKMSSTDISDTGLETLIKRNETVRLESIDITDTKVTTDGARRLSEAFRQMYITYGPSKVP